jgi:butyrate kinase
MNIQTVAANLRTTIAGKEKMLEEFESVTLRNGANLEVIYVMKEFLKVNIAELKRILQDVEQCEFDYDELKEDLKEANGRVRQLEQQASYGTLDGPMIKMFRED